MSTAPFALTGAEVAAVVASLAPRLVGARIQRVWQPELATIVLAVYGDAGVVYPVFSATSGAVRISEAAGKPALPEQPWALGQWLRAQAMGAQLLGLRCLGVSGADRVIRLDFTGGALIAELLPRGGCLLALDAHGVIRAAAQLPDGLRELHTGGPYVPLAPRPPRDEPPPRFATPAEVESHARLIQAARLDEAARAERTRWLDAAVSRLERLREHLARDLVKLGDFEQSRLWGELLAAQWARLGLSRGATVARVQNWYEDGAPEIEVPLDPKLDGPRNVERLFHRYRKGRDGRATVEKRQFEVECQLEAVARLAATVADPEPTLAALRSMGLAPKRTSVPAGTRRAPPPERLPYRLFVSRAGERVLVGRGGADNHALTFRVARGNDTWLHVRDAPGAHVIVPQPARGREPHPESLLDAAALALHHSDLRGEPVGEVTITARKHVRAVPGGPPGRVTVAASRTLTVADVLSRVERLYRAVAAGEVP